MSFKNSLIALFDRPDRGHVELAAVVVGVAPADGWNTGRAFVSLVLAGVALLAALEMLDQIGAGGESLWCSFMGHSQVISSVRLS